MLIKATILAALLASTPLYLTASVQGGSTDGGGGSAPRQEQWEGERQRLREELTSARRRAEAAEQRVAELATQLEECMDLLEASSQERRRNCTPSRRLLTQYQWMDRRGHENRAARTLDRIVEDRGDDNGRLNRMAWELMTDNETAGKFDRVAFALADRMQRNADELSHRALDTVALAYFLNGRVDEAIGFQQQAIERGGDGDEYRRRLRTYQAARQVAADAPRLERRIHDE